LPPEAESTVWDAARPQKMKEIAANADIGLIVADYAVAHTGSIVTMSSGRKGRTVSLLPATLMILVPAPVIKTRLGEVMREIGKIEISNMPAGIHFITGPSRSADIENDLTIGVHGPGMVYALVVQ
jgi:L-lactate dehydrogenase complex protein LldG